MTSIIDTLHIEDVRFIIRSRAFYKVVEGKYIRDVCNWSYALDAGLIRRAAEFFYINPDDVKAVMDTSLHPNALINAIKVHPYIHAIFEDVCNGTQNLAYAYITGVGYWSTEIDRLHDLGYRIQSQSHRGFMYYHYSDRQSATKDGWNNNFVKVLDRPFAIRYLSFD